MVGVHLHPPYQAEEEVRHHFHQAMEEVLSRQIARQAEVEKNRPYSVLHQGRADQATLRYRHQAGI